MEQTDSCERGDGLGTGRKKQCIDTYNSVVMARGKADSAERRKWAKEGEMGWKGTFLGVMGA